MNKIILLIITIAVVECQNPEQNCDNTDTLLYILLGMTTLILAMSMCMVWHCERIDTKMNDILYPRGMIDAELLPEY